MGLRVGVKKLIRSDTAGQSRFKQLELFGGVVAPVEGVLAHDMVVLGLDGRLVVLAIRPGAGLVDIAFLHPGRHLVVDELAAVVGVEADQREREIAGQLADGCDDPSVPGRDYALKDAEAPATSKRSK